jgi:hypothetical protein
LAALDGTIRERSDVYNALKATEGDAKATWMANGTEWPGTWVEPAENHVKGHHAGVVQVQNHLYLWLSRSLNNLDIYICLKSEKSRYVLLPRFQGYFDFSRCI